VNANLNKRLLLETEHTDSHSLSTKQLITSDHYLSVVATYYKLTTLLPSCSNFCQSEAVTSNMCIKWLQFPYRY